MQNTLEAFGVGPKITHQINTLYNHPTARVRVNGTVPGLFEMQNGRQGCPLSSFFVLSLEPLLAGTRENPDITGIKIEGKEHKLAAYADDILFYMSSPRIPLPNLMERLKTYGDKSNFKMNQTKSEILNIKVRKREKQIYQHEFPFI